MKIDDTTELIAVTLINIDIGKDFHLSEKDKSHCHFNDPFPIGKYIVMLRLDWDDIDENGDPMLDADIWI